MTRTRHVVATLTAAVVVAIGAMTMLDAQGRGAAGPGRMGGAPGPRGGGPGMGRGGPGIPPPVMALLNLSTDQQAKFDEIMQNLQTEAAPLLDEQHDAQASLHSAVFDDARDDGKIANLASKVSALEDQLTAIHLKAMKAISDILTSDQRAVMRTHGFAH